MPRIVSEADVGQNDVTQDEKAEDKADEQTSHIVECHRDKQIPEAVRLMNSILSQEVVS